MKQLMKPKPHARRTKKEIKEETCADEATYEAKTARNKKKKQKLNRLACG